MTKVPCVTELWSISAADQRGFCFNVKLAVVISHWSGFECFFQWAVTKNKITHSGLYKVKSQYPLNSLASKVHSCK